MKKFQFKLQAILTLRQRTEQKMLEKYSQAVLSRQTSMIQLTEAEQALSQARTAAREQTSAGCTACAAKQMEDHGRHLEIQRKTADQALGRAEVELNQAFQRMLVARQEREAVETYLAHQRELHDRNLATEERKTIEDIVNRRSPAALFGRMTPGSAWS